jgi:signal transduction histidine kinase
MKFSDINYVNAGASLTFVLLIALILGGNGLVIWQFRIVSRQTDRLTGMSQQLVAVQQLQEQLFTFHGRLDQIAHAKDAGRLVTEARPLLRALLEQTQRARNTFTYLPSELSTDSLDAIDVAFPAQLEGITELARSGDWEAVNLRLANQLKPMEAQISALVSTIANQVNTQMGQAVATMDNLQNRILFIVPTTTILTFLLAVSFGWFTARRIIELRMDERVQERMRIARELHDTLLQSMHGLMFQFQAARNMLPRSPENAMHTLDEAIVGTREAIAESRDAIHDLRSQPVGEGDLAKLLEAAGQELAGVEATNGNSPAFRLIMEGEPQKVSPALQDEVYRIAREVMRNAFRHAGASQIETEIRYDKNQIRVRIRDDGKGIDPKVLEARRPGHWGLPGVRERAEQIGAQLKIWSEDGAGTEIELTVPPALAYKDAGNSSRFKLFRKDGQS